MNNSSKLMVLGPAGKLIEAAQKLGYDVIMVGNVNRLDKTYDNLKYYPVDYRNMDEVLAIAKEENIDGIVAISEFAVRTVAYVAEKLNLQGSPVDSVVRLNSKAGFRELQHKLGVFAPEYILTASFEEAINSITQLNFPVVLKPNYCSGSRGTHIVPDYEAFLLSKDSWILCSDYSFDNLVCIEEYVEMDRLDAYVEQDIFVLGDRIIWDGIDTCFRSSRLRIVAMTDVFPIIATDEQLRDIKKEIETIIRGSGIVHGEYNIEMYRFPDGRLFTIEINARQGGFGGPEMMKKHTGIDYDKLLVTTAVGDNTYFDEVFRRSVENRLDKKFVCRQPVMPIRSGVFANIHISDEIKPYVTYIETVAQPGDVINMDSINAYDVLGYVDLEFATREQQLAFAYDIEKYIYPEYGRI